MGPILRIGIFKNMFLDLAHTREPAFEASRLFTLESYHIPKDVSADERFGMIQQRQVATRLGLCISWKDVQENRKQNVNNSSNCLKALGLRLALLLLIVPLTFNIQSKVGLRDLVSIRSIFSNS